MSFDAAAFGPITLNHLPPFAQRLRHAVHVETRMGRVRRTMDERWARALRAKGINVGEGSQHGSSDKTETGKFLESKIVAAKGKSRQAAANTVSRATPFKATGHKDGISRQGN